MDVSRIDYQIFEWRERSIRPRYKYLNFRINALLRDADITFDNISECREIKDSVARFLFDRFKNEWLGDVNRLRKLEELIMNI